MNKKEFINKWNDIGDIQKIIVLKNKAQFYADGYDFTFDFSIDGIEKVEFILNQNEIGNCFIKDISYMV